MPRRPPSGELTHAPTVPNLYRAMTYLRARQAVEFDGLGVSATVVHGADWGGKRNFLRSWCACAPDHVLRGSDLPCGCRGADRGVPAPQIHVLRGSDSACVRR